MLIQVFYFFNLKIKYKIKYNKYYLLKNLGYVLELLVFFQIYSLIDIFKRFEALTTVNEIMANLFPLFKLLLKILTSIHIVCITFHFIGIL